MSTPPDVTKIPLPKDPRHQRFADLVLRGRPPIEAVYEAGFRPKSRKVASTMASRFSQRNDVIAYSAAVRTEATTETCLTIAEKREFLAKVLRTPITRLRPNDPDDDNNVLIKKYKRKVREGNEEEPDAWIYEEIEKYDALRAIESDNRLAGDDPETSAIQALAAALQTLGSSKSALPIDRM